MPKQPRAIKPDSAGKANTVKQWHKRAAAIVGSLSLNIEHRHLSRGELIDWANELSDLAEEMRTLANNSQRRDP